jgi:ketosteroid isomerase-like protein
LVVAVFGILFLTGATPPRQDPSPEEEVREVEQAFAQTMADRDHAAFASFLSEEAVFFGGGGAIRGSAAVEAAWAPFFEGPDAPFSWEPETVEVLETGDLAFSSGPVMDPQGNVTAIFNSIWRREADGVWRVVFDKGCAVSAPSPGGGGCSACR